jgi:hypothetical protein
VGTGPREENASNQKEHDPEKHALGLDARVDTGFPKRSCSINKLARLRFNQKQTRSSRSILA